MTESLSEWLQNPTYVIGAIIILLFSLFGRFLSPRLWLRRSEGLASVPEAGQAQHIRRPDGTVLYVETYGPIDAPPLVLTHGCGGDQTEWDQVKHSFAKTYRLIVWDLPGFGRSSWADNHDFSMEKMARDLEAVLGLANGRPAVLVGHSTGGMVVLTFCKMFPEHLGKSVAGLVLAHTCARNPLYSVRPTWLMPRLQKILLEPILYLMIAFSPIVSLVIKIGYLNGVAHWKIHSEMFAKTESREQLDGAAWFVFKAPISATARTNLAMFRYDATSILSRINVPVLVVGGDKDTTTVPEASRAIAQAVPDAELLILSPAKHLGIIERHHEFAAALRRFVDGCQQPRLS